MPPLGACSSLQMFAAMFYGSSPPPGNISYPYPPPMPYNTSGGQYNASWMNYTGPGMQQEPICDAARLPELSMQGRVLMAWRNSLGVSNYQPVLAAWGMADPCAFGWAGVECENGTVVGLSLAAPSYNVPQDGGPAHVPPTYANGAINWQVLRNLTSLRALGLEVSCSGTSWRVFTNIFMRFQSDDISGDVTVHRRSSQVVDGTHVC